MHTDRLKDTIFIPPE